MRVGIPKEVRSGERRVAATPDTVTKLIDMGFEVQIEKGAGIEANYFDAAYADAGASLVDAAQVWSESDLVLKVEPPNNDEVAQLKEGAHLISFIWPGENEGLLDALKARKATCIAMENIPRITRAQKMDARSSMDNIRGYRAVIEAANEFGSFFTGQITAAGRVAPAKVLIVGAGGRGSQPVQPKGSEPLFVPSMSGQLLRTKYRALGANSSRCPSMSPAMVVVAMPRP